MITPQTNIDLEGIATKFKELQSFVLCGHISPDGDCIGSQLALAAALRSLGKEVCCVLVKSGTVEDSLTFLPGAKDMIAAEEYTGTPDAFVACDVPRIDRIGDAAAIHERAKHTFTIDHHAFESTMSDYTYVDPDSASTSMIIWELIKVMGVTRDKDMALCAYVGLLTDTGGFRFQNTDSDAFEAASEMVAAGVQPAGIAAAVFQNRSLASLRLEAIALEHMYIAPDGSYALSYIMLDDIARVGGVKTDVDPIIDILRSLKGVRVACMLREQEGSVRGSIRSKDETDVSAFARRFKGGGHKAAAGFTVFSPMEKSLEKVKAALNETLGVSPSESAESKGDNEGLPEKRIEA